MFDVVPIFDECIAVDVSATIKISAEIFVEILSESVIPQLNDWSPFTVPEEGNDCN